MPGTWMRRSILPDAFQGRAWGGRRFGRWSRSRSAQRIDGCEPNKRPNKRPNIRRQAMRFMMIVKATKNSEAGVMPNEALLGAMAKYNEELLKAGMLLDLTGLQPSSKGARVKFSGGNRTVIDGPFAETKELIAGYWLIKANSREEVIEWAKRVPF